MSATIAATAAAEAIGASHRQRQAGSAVLALCRRAIPGDAASAGKHDDRHRQRDAAAQGGGEVGRRHGDVGERADQRERRQKNRRDHDEAEEPDARFGR